MASARQTPAHGLVLDHGLGTRKLEHCVTILGLPTCQLVYAWEGCVISAVAAKMASEDETVEGEQTNVSPPSHMPQYLG